LPNIKVKILKPGDQVLNIWPDEGGIRIAVKNYKGEVMVYLISQDEQNLPRIDNKSSWLITFGEDEIEASLFSDNDSNDSQTDSDDQIVKIQTF
jgi:hypothetical protein